MHVQTIAAVLAECLHADIQLTLATNSQNWLITSITLDGNSLRICGENGNSRLSMPVNLSRMCAKLVTTEGHICFFGGWGDIFTIRPVTPSNIHAIVSTYNKTLAKLQNAQASQDLHLS